MNHELHAPEGPRFDEVVQTVAELADRFAPTYTMTKLPSYVRDNPSLHSNL